LSALLADTKRGALEVTLKHRVRAFFQGTEVIFVKGPLNGLLALISFLLAAGAFWLYRSSQPANTLYLVGLIAFGLLFIVFGGMFLSGRVNKTEEIHITE
jgi:hypothetical protein